MKRTHWVTYLAAICVVAMTTLTAFGQANFFVPPGGTGPWDTTSNWTLAHVPQTGETAIIQSSRVATINTVNPTAIDFLRVADNDTGPIDGTLNIQTGASLNVAQQVLLGLGGPSDNHGVINQTGGSLTVGDALFIAFDSSHTAEYNLSGGTVTTKNLWFRFGHGTLTQTGGTMNAQQLVLAEGGNPLSSSLYDMQGGLFNVSGAANIGKAPGAGDPFAPFSHGSMNLSGGIATFGQLLFGTDATDQIHMFGPGILRVLQSAYSPVNALADIASNKIAGTGLIVSTVVVGGNTYTQVAGVPEPTSVGLLMVGVVTAVMAQGWRRGRRRSV